MKVTISESQFKRMVDNSNRWGLIGISEGGKRMTQDEFIEESQKKHKNDDGTPKYTYEKVNYIDSKTPVIITCPEHGDFPRSPNDHLSGLGQGCKTCGIERRSKNKISKAAAVFKEKSQKEHINDDGTPKYTYEKVNYINSKTPVIITCPEHGDWDTTTPSDHLSGAGCPKCGVESRTKKLTSSSSKFIENAQKEHQNPDGTPKFTYDKVNYINNKTPVIITCPEHGDWDTTTPKNHLNGTGCPKCNESKGETTLEEYFIKNKIKHETQGTFKQCTNQIEGTYCRKLPFDFYLNDENILVEIDGDFHFEKNRQRIEGFQRRVFLDKLKNDYAEKNAKKIIRIYWNSKPSTDKKKNELFETFNKLLIQTNPSIPGTNIYLSDDYPKKGWNAPDSDQKDIEPINEIILRIKSLMK
jgi:very-short-patch-repair endonuclease